MVAMRLRTLRQIYGWQVHPVPLAQARKILVLRPDEIGDVVLTTAFLRELRRAAPQAHIELIVKRACRELVEHCPYVNAVHAFDFSSDNRRRLRLCWGAWRLRLNRRVPTDFDLVLLPRRGPDIYDSVFLGHLLGGKGAILAHRESAEQAASDGQRWLPQGLASYTNRHVEHEVLHNLRFLQWCGATEAGSHDLELWSADADQEFARAWLDRHFASNRPLLPSAPISAMHVYSSQKTRRPDEFGDAAKIGAEHGNAPGKGFKRHQRSRLKAARGHGDQVIIGHDASHRVRRNCRMQVQAAVLSRLRREQCCGDRNHMAGARGSGAIARRRSGADVGARREGCLAERSR
jgi:hypothetical protein